MLQAILTRPGVPEAGRLEALGTLAGERRTNPTDQLLATLESLGPAQAAAAADLSSLLRRQPAEDLRPLAERLAQLAAGSKLGAVRQGATAAAILVEGSVAPYWERATGSASELTGLLRAIPLVPDPGVRATADPVVRSLFRALPPAIAAEVDGVEGTVGRFVRVSLPRRGTLTLAEVEVFSEGDNVARAGRATQSSTSHGGEASRGIDGNTSGSYGAGGQTHSRENSDQPWWELDLGAEVPVERIVIWNRTDGSLGDRLEKFDLAVLDGGRTPVWERPKNPAPREKVTFELEGDAAGALRRAAIAALVSTGHRQSATFKGLAALIRDGDQRRAAADGIRQLPRSAWDPAAAGETARSLLAWAAEVPAAERTGQSFVELVQLAGEMAGHLDPSDAARVRARLRQLAVGVVIVKTVREQLKFDTPQIVVGAGRPFEMIFENNDLMEHNLVLLAPGARTEIGTAAMTLPITYRDDQGRAYVPKSDKVLAATQMLEPGEREVLKLTAPATPGTYEYVCTFPGHWTIMWGKLVVVADVEAFLRENPNDPGVVLDAGR